MNVLSCVGIEPHPAIGKIIASAVLDPDAGRSGDGAVKIEFVDGSVLTLEDDYRSCCETRFLSSDDDLQSITGATLLEVVVSSASVTEGDDEYEGQNVREVNFLNIVTSVTTVQFAAHNHHNGYYSGINVVASFSTGGESERNSAYVPSDAFPALDWLPVTGGGFEALTAPGPDFWDVYNSNRRELYAAGFSVSAADHHGERRWFVHFNPTKAGPESVAAAVATAREKYRVSQLSKSEQQLIAEEADRKRRAEWEAGRTAREEAERKRQEESAARRLAQQTHAHDQAVECLKRWGELCHQKVRLRELAEMAIAELWYPQFKEIGKLVAKTEQKARARRIAAENDDAPGVAWPEHVVIAAVEHLTYVDDDHAEVANNRGWSRADSSVGHWCHGEFSGGDRELALRAARRLVGKYRKQLTDAGIVPVHVGAIDLPKVASEQLQAAIDAQENV